MSNSIKLSPSDRFVLSLVVTATSIIADGILKLELAHSSGEQLPPWEPGAHIDIRLPSRKVRSYSLCGAPSDDVYSIAILLDENGRGGSREIHSTVVLHHVLAATLPRNDFKLVNAPRYLFIGGGIGVTPILPMVRCVATGKAAWHVLYLGRSRRRMAFLNELRELEKMPEGRVDVVVTEEGNRLALRRILYELSAECAVYCCGPARLLDEAEAIHADSFAEYSLHIERFGRPTGASDMNQVLQEADEERDNQTSLTECAVFCDPDGPFEVELRKTGRTLTVQPGESILNAARKVKTGLTFSCSEGYCGTCETRVLAGIPDHRDEVLSDEEKAENKTMMICIGRSKTRKIVLDL